MEALAHRIRSLRWGVQAPSQPEAFAVRKWLRDELHGSLLPAFERAFDEADSKGGVLRIPKLELHLEVANADEIADRLPDLIRRRLAELLRSAASDAALAAEQAGEPVHPFTHATAEADRLQSLVRYLKTGVLPWPLASSDRTAILAQLHSIAAADELVWMLAPAADASPLPLAERVASCFRLLQLIPEEEWVAVAKAVAAKLPHETGRELVEAVAALAHGEIGRASRHARLRLAAAAVAMGVANLDSMRVGGLAAAMAPTGKEALAAVVAPMVKEALAAIEDSIAPLPENAAAFWRRWLSIGPEDSLDRPPRSESPHGGVAAQGRHPAAALSTDLRELPGKTVADNVAKEQVPAPEPSSPAERQARSGGRKASRESSTASVAAAPEEVWTAARSNDAEEQEEAVPKRAAEDQISLPATSPSKRQVRTGGRKILQKSSAASGKAASRDRGAAVHRTGMQEPQETAVPPGATGDEGLMSAAFPSVEREPRLGVRQKTLQKRSAPDRAAADAVGGESKPGASPSSRSAQRSAAASDSRGSSALPPVRTESRSIDGPGTFERSFPAGAEARSKGARKGPRDRAVASDAATTSERKRETSAFLPRLEPRSEELREAVLKSFGVPDRREVDLRVPDRSVFPLAVPHAGLILLHPFLSRFFESTGIKDPRQAALPAATLPRAASLLHLLATGEDEVFEFELGFVKILLGLEPAFALPVSGGLLREGDREEAGALLQAVLGHWTALKNTSAEALRQSFLQRRGLMREEEQGFRLRVEPESFDVLLGTLPWGLGTVKLPWMKKPIFTDWPTP